MRSKNCIHTCDHLDLKTRVVTTSFRADTVSNAFRFLSIQRPVGKRTLFIVMLPKGARHHVGGELRIVADPAAQKRDKQRYCLLMAPQVYCTVSRVSWSHKLKSSLAYVNASKPGPMQRMILHESCGRHMICVRCRWRLWNSQRLLTLR